MMNDGLQFGASPRTHENAKSGGVPLEVRAMARELGIAPEDLCQAEEMWSKLNEISQNDPDSYKKLVQVSAKHVERQGGGVKAKVVDLEKENNPNVEENSEFNEEEERVAEQILEKHFGGGTKPRLDPNPGFVIKCEASNGKKIMINCCFHSAVQPAISASGDQLIDIANDANVSTNGLQVPMVVGTSRDCQVSDGIGKAVDVLFHPWVITYATTNRDFKREVSQLAIQWVRTECPELHLSDAAKYKWKHINSTYKGGTGPDNSHPIPFYIHDEQIDKKKQPKKQVDHNLLAPQGLTATPESLLTRLRQKDQKEKSLDEEPIELRLQPPPKPNKGKVLIQEIGSEDKDVNPDTEQVSVPQVLEQNEDGGFDLSEVTDTKKVAAPKLDFKNKPKKKEPVVKKGFLQQKTKKPLYPPQGSDQGQKEGVYSRFFGKCQVIDTAEIKKKEEEHKKKSKPFEFKKGFLFDDEDNTQISPDQPNNVTPAMEELIAEADPEFCRTSIPQNEPDDELEHTLQALRTFSQGLDFGKNTTSQQDAQPKEEVVTYGGVEETKHGETLPPPPPNFENDTGFKRGFLQRAYELKELEASADGRRQVKLTAVIKGATAFSDLTLDVAQRLILISSAPLDFQLKVPIDFDIDPNLTKAAFSKKNSRLSITLFSSATSLNTSSS